MEKEKSQELPLLSPITKRKSARCYLIGIFTLGYLSWVAVHAQREFWAMSKKTIKDQAPDTKSQFFGTIDTGLFLTYGVFQFGTGMIGDHVNKRYVLAVSYAIQAILFSLVGLVGNSAFTGYQEGDFDAYSSRLWQFLLIFMGIGLVQSVDLPSLIAVLSNWTHQGNRGRVTGLWSTCASVGNILGLQIAPLLLTHWDNEWYLLMWLVGGTYVFISLAMWLFMVPDPAEVQIQIETNDHQLIASSDEKIRWIDALCAPKVALCGAAYFCIKFSIYAILLWMPIFLSQTRQFENHEIANLLTVYEVATIAGTAILGALTDLSHKKRMPIVVGAVISASIVCFILTFKFISLSSMGLNITMALLGFPLGATHHIVSITVSADLGKAQQGKQATGTISGIIDGFGSMGIACGMFSLGMLVDAFGYQWGFMFLVSCVITLALVPLTILLRRDLAEIRQLQTS